ncbi:MAG: D-alanyl-D-alanine carboxypeptidase family protein [Lachnospiraceae bacterium]|nr:D-alanyl-D-alanine carboxypeptidase family protein [Lachnospiraceae bacterium]
MLCAGKLKIRRMLSMAFLLPMLLSALAAAWNPFSVCAQAAPPEVGSKAAILMEASTGNVIYEKNADERRSPASITKIMTLILIFDALEQGEITMEEMVTTSAHAKSMGGSQVYLEEGEQQTVETLIKCIVMASGNDASVTMAERIGGTEEAFVGMMNKRAEGLGMTQTHFTDCCGLTESPKHLTTARDIAVMSRELIGKYPQIMDYSTIWMDTIIHRTSKGESEFGLSNTNKLLKMQTDFTVTGLKTGSTSLAGCCLSATGRKDGIDMIAVVLAAENYKIRFSEAKSLLDYGYSVCSRYEDTSPPKLENLKVDGGKKETAALKYEGSFSLIRTDGKAFGKVEKKLELPDSLKAPVKAGDKAGILAYYQGKEKLGEVQILAAEDVKKASYRDYLLRLWRQFFGIAQCE